MCIGLEGMKLHLTTCAFDSKPAAAIEQPPAAAIEQPPPLEFANGSSSSEDSMEQDEESIPQHVLTKYSSAFNILSEEGKKALFNIIGDPSTSSIEVTVEYAIELAIGVHSEERKQLLLEL